MANELIRYITAQDIQPQVQKLQGINLPEQVDMTANAYEQTRQNVHTAYDQVRKAMSARSAAYAAEAEARGRRAGAPSELAGIAQTVNEGIAIYGKLQADKAKQAAAEQEAIYDRDSALAKGAIQEQLLQMDARIRESGQRGGIDTTRAAIQRIIDVDYANLPAERRAQLAEVYFTPLREEEQRMTSRMFEEASANRDDSEAQRTSLVRLGIVSELTALQNPSNSPQTATSIVSRIMTRAAELTPDLDGMARIRVLQPVFDAVVSEYQVGEEARQALMRASNGMQGFYQAMTEAQQAGLLQNPNQATIIAHTYATSFGVPELADSWMSEGQLLGQAVTYQENVERLRQMTFDANNRALAAQHPTYLADAATTLAWNWMNEATPGDAVRRAYVKEHPDEATEVERMALSLTENWTGYQTQYHALNDQISQALQAQQTMAVRRDPSQLPPNTLYLDTLSGRYRRAEVAGEDMAIFLAPQVTQEAYQASVNRVLNLQQQLTQLVQRGMREGINVQNIGDTNPITGFRNRVSAVESELNAVPPQANNPPSPFPNFNYGGNSQRYAGMPPVQALARTPTNMILPIAAGHNATITSEYGNRRHPIHGDVRLHAGLDISPGGGGDVGAVTVQGGEVIAVRDWSGYGGTVMVRTPDGHVEQYSHLRRFFVNVGDVVPAGVPVGVIGGGRGDRMAGGSTGRHLHFQVWRPGTTEFSNTRNDTLDPVQYLNGRQYTQPRAPNGLGAPPSQPMGQTMAASPVSMQAVNGSWLTAFLGYTPPWLTRPGSPVATPAEQVFTPTNPMPATRAPIQRGAYPRTNNPRNNYGYRAIARDPQFAAALANTANEFNIPAQWLADIMAMESTTDFNPNIENGLGAIGLIQAMPDTYRALGLTRSEMLNLSRTQYLQRVVRPYLQEFRGRLNTIEDVLAAIFGGNRLHRKSPEERASIGDGNISFANYARSLGSRVGRRYRTSYDAAIPEGRPHTVPQPGCATCQAQMTRFRTITPHIAQ